MQTKEWSNAQKPRWKRQRRNQSFYICGVINSRGDGEKRVLNTNLMEYICTRANLNQAYMKVRSNKGSSGVDAMSIEGVSAYIREHREQIVNSLLEGSYEPNLIKGVQIPKPDGSKRQLGIPTVLDRIIQQAILQVLQPLIDPSFSESSYGFRPGRSAHMALRQARSYVNVGYIYVVDMDLEKFFDRVNHDILMSKLTRYICDKVLLKIIRKYLEAGILSNGEVKERIVGTPQGGPLSPLLSNIMLDELDGELEARGHKFCRYADDCNIYVKSQAAGERVMESVTKFIVQRLKLQVNASKSAVALVWKRKFLGYSFRSDGELKVARVALERFKQRIRELTRRSGGKILEYIVYKANQYLNGWSSYFRLSKNQRDIQEMDSWIRRRLRCYRLKQCKKISGIRTFLTKLGVNPKQARNISMSGKGWWRLSLTPALNKGMSIEWFRQLGLVNLEQKIREFNSLDETAGCDNARPVV